jgi:hypothetical protein
MTFLPLKLLFIQKLKIKKDMIQKWLVVFVLFCLTTSAFAQDKITLQEERLSDFYPQSLFRTRAKAYAFKVGEDDLQPVGVKGRNIEAVLMQDEAAYKEFKKFKRKINGGLVPYGIGTAAYLSTPFLINGNDTDQDAAKKSIVTLSVLTVGAVTGYIMQRRSIRNLKNAVEIYNLNLE